MKTAVRSMACIGALFLILGIVLFLSGGHIGAFPRSDTAPWGFVVLGAIYLIGAVGIFLSGREDAAQAEAQNVAAKAAGMKAAMIAFTVQTLLLFTATILLIFTGYLDMVPAFVLMAVLIISVIVFLIAQILYRKNNRKE